MFLGQYKNSSFVIFGVQYLDGLIVGECFIGPSPDAPDAFDGSDPIVGDEY